MPGVWRSTAMEYDGMIDTDEIEIERNDGTTRITYDHPMATIDVQFPTVFEDRVIEAIEEAKDEQKAMFEHVQEVLGSDD